MEHTTAFMRSGMNVVVHWAGSTRSNASAHTKFGHVASSLLVLQSVLKMRRRISLQFVVAPAVLLLQCAPTEDAACSYRSTAMVQGFHTEDALPTGSCNGTHDCTYAIGHACGGGELGRVDQVECSCSNGRWSCNVKTPGATACHDAMTDATIE